MLDTQPYQICYTILSSYTTQSNLQVNFGYSVWSFWPFLYYLRDRRKMWQFFSNEISFIWLRPPTHPLQMKVWKTENRCIINQTPPNNIGFRTMYSPYACHDKGSIYESLSFKNHRHLISSKCTNNSTNILYQ
jgi:hypothetical protein